MLTTEETIVSTRQQLQSWRQSGQTIAFVPTMGNLHAGHLGLVDEAKKHADRVVVSIFVNPTQFAEGEDFSCYPRTREQDLEQLAARGVDLVFIPEVSEMYAPPNLTVVDVNDLSAQLCGEFRPGHFAGVATVVCRLLNIVQADFAMFGEKDYQQLVLIKTLVSDLKIPVRIIGVPTVRADDGLALSSRNQYLSEQQRSIAVMLYQALCTGRDQLLLGDTVNYRHIEEQQMQWLNQAGFSVEYFAIRNADNLSPPQENADDQQLVVLVAARLGQTRLIDNVLI
jgi:pantoate--beta-alanine ligase